MIQINLLPDIKKEHLKAVRQKKAILSTATISSGVFLAVVVLLALAVFGVQKARIDSLTKSIEEDIAQLKGVQDLDKVLTIQNQLMALPALYEGKPNAGNVFGYISAVTPADVKLSSTQLSFDPATQATNNMEISGSTATFKDVNRFADILKNAKYELIDTGSDKKIEGNAFKSVVIESISKDKQSTEGGATLFTIVIQYDPEIFNIEYDKVSLKVPKITSSVSSTEKPELNDKPFGEAGE